MPDTPRVINRARGRAPVINEGVPPLIQIIQIDHTTSHKLASLIVLVTLSPSFTTVCTLRTGDETSTLPRGRQRRTQSVRTMYQLSGVLFCNDA